MEAFLADDVRGDVAVLSGQNSNKQQFTAHAPASREPSHLYSLNKLHVYGMWDDPARKTICK